MDLARFSSQARLAQGATLGATALLALGLAAAIWAGGGPIPLAAEQTGLAPAPSAGGTGLVWGGTLLPLLAGVWVLLGVAQLFGHYAKGEVLTCGAAAAVQRIGRRLLCAALVGLVAPTVVALGLTLGAAPGGRVLALTVGSGPVLAALMGVLLIMVGRALALGASAAEEMRHVV